MGQINICASVHAGITAIERTVHHTHDCQKCDYLGSDRSRDYYHCDGSLIIRDGSKGWEYESAPRMIAVRYAEDDTSNPYWATVVALYWQFVNDTQGMGENNAKR